MFEAAKCTGIINRTCDRRRALLSFLADAYQVFVYTPVAGQSPPLHPAGARSDVRRATAEFSVAASFNIAQCKGVIAFAEEKAIPDPDAACVVIADPQAVADGIRSVTSKLKFEVRFIRE
jgi:hypothetical protein